MIDHVNIPVTNFDRSTTFYDAVLGALGCPRFGVDGRAAGYGAETWQFGVVETAGVFTRLHVAFVAQSRSQVDRFHAAALAQGGRSNGAPGVRAEYDAGYYAAFVLDPDGHNIEAVCRG